MLVIGLTGGIGSGKSTAATFFSELNVPVIDADKIAHQITAEKKTQQALIDYFGTSILDNHGILDRSKLRRLVFNNSNQKKWLEALLHPLILEKIKKQLSALKTQYCIVVIPLLIETGPYSFIDRILVVDAPEAVCLERSTARDQVNAEDLHKIIVNQVSREKRLEQANEVLHNEGTLDDLRQQVESLHRYYLHLDSGPR